VDSEEIREMTEHAKLIYAQAVILALLAGCIIAAWVRSVT
jgi:hypothetical protein